jgi:hypothetical protein
MKTIAEIDRAIVECIHEKHSVDKHKRLSLLYVGKEEWKTLKSSGRLNKPKEGWYGVSGEYKDMEVCRLDCDSFLEVF